MFFETIAKFDTFQFFVGYLLVIWTVYKIYLSSFAIKLRTFNFFDNFHYRWSGIWNYISLFCTLYNSYEFLVTRATNTTRELHMLRQLFCYFVTLGGLSKKCVLERQRKRTLNVTYSLILHWIQTSSALLLSDRKKKCN